MRGTNLSRVPRWAAMLALGVSLVWSVGGVTADLGAAASPSATLDQALSGSLDQITALPHYGNLALVDPASHQALRSLGQLSDDSVAQMRASTDGRTRSALIFRLSWCGDIAGLLELNAWLDDHSKAIPLGAPTASGYDMVEQTVGEYLQRVYDEWLGYFPSIGKHETGAEVFARVCGEIADPHTLAYPMAMLISRWKAGDLADGVPVMERFHSQPATIRWLVIAELSSHVLPEENRKLELQSLGPAMIADLKSDKVLTATEPRYQGDSGKLLHESLRKQIKLELEAAGL